MKTLTLPSAANFFLLFLLAILIAAASVSWNGSLHWADQQRVAHLGFLALAACAFLWKTPRSFYASCTLSLLLIPFSLGLLSSLLAEYPSYALKDWSLFVGFVFLAYFFSARCATETTLLYGLWGLALAALLNAYFFLLYYALAFISQIYVLDAYVLFYGFSNPRFMNQFQGLALPVMAYLIGYYTVHRQKYSTLFIGLLFAGLAVQWCLAFTLGGRALWLGLLVSHGLLLLFFYRFRQLILWQLAAALVGFLLFWLLFSVIPEQLGLSLKTVSSLRTSSSGRFELWQGVLGVFAQAPWLGVGPMHLAADWSLTFPSPHQALLQFLSEWGILATLLLLAIVAKGMWVGTLYLKSTLSTTLDATLWLAFVIYLVIVQFDGVSTPYTHLWLAVLVGIALQRWAPVQPTTQPAPAKSYFEWFKPLWIWRFFAFLVAFTCLSVLVYELPKLAEQAKAHAENYHPDLNPRFWTQGWIPMNPDSTAK